MSSGGSGSGSSPAAAAPTLDPSMIAALVNVIQTGAGPDMIKMQQQLLERLLLTGDVVPSRIPPPLNITEVGGYINLLASLGQTTLETEMIASALGVAPPLSLLTAPAGHPLAMVALPNDRPSGNSQPTIPLTWYVRSDFQGALKAALNFVHASGGVLPILSPKPSLAPQSPAFVAPADWLPYIGREVSVLPMVALNDPTSDPVALASQTSGGPYKIVSAATGSGAPAPAQWYALKWSGGPLAQISLPATRFIDLAPVLANAAFYPASPITAPAKPSDVSWSKLTNVAGLVPGVTTLQSELSLLYSPNEIGASALAAYLQYVWDGTTFSSP